MTYEAGAMIVPVPLSVAIVLMILGGLAYLYDLVVVLPRRRRAKNARRNAMYAGSPAAGGVQPPAHPPVPGWQPAPVEAPVAPVIQALAVPQENPAPGWFTDPLGGPDIRYWDGQVWTDHLHPRT